MDPADTPTHGGLGASDAGWRDRAGLLRLDHQVSPTTSRCVGEEQFMVHHRAGNPGRVRRLIQAMSLSSERRGP